MGARPRRSLPRPAPLPRAARSWPPTAMPPPSPQHSAQDAARRPRTPRPRRSPAAARRPRFVPSPAPQTPPLPHPLRMGRASLKKATAVGPRRVKLRKRQRGTHSLKGRWKNAAEGGKGRRGQAWFLRGSFRYPVCPPRPAPTHCVLPITLPRKMILTVESGDWQVHSWCLTCHLTLRSPQTPVAEYLGWP